MQVTLRARDMGFPAVEVTGSGVLGIELLSSTRTASALYHRAISLAPPFLTFHFYMGSMDPVYVLGLA